MRWRPLPSEPRAWLVSGVDDLGQTVRATYAQRDTAECHRDEINRHGGKALVAPVNGGLATPQILGRVSSTNMEGDK